MARVLGSLEPSGELEAREALREFFTAVHEADGAGELRRLYACFWQQAHGEVLVLPESPGKVPPITGGLRAKPAKNGR